MARGLGVPVDRAGITAGVRRAPGAPPCARRHRVVLEPRAVGGHVRPTVDQVKALSSRPRLCVLLRDVVVALVGLGIGAAGTTLVIGLAHAGTRLLG